MKTEEKPLPTLEELARHAVAPDQPDTPGAMPETVLAVLAAAVIGMDVSFPLLQMIAAQPEAHRQHSLARLQAHCHHGIGTLYIKAGQWEQARAALLVVRA